MRKIIEITINTQKKGLYQMKLCPDFFLLICYDDDLAITTLLFVVSAETVQLDPLVTASTCCPPISIFWALPAVCQFAWVCLAGIVFDSIVDVPSQVNKFAVTSA